MGGREGGMGLRIGSHCWGWGDARLQLVVGHDVAVLFVLGLNLRNDGVCYVIHDKPGGGRGSEGLNVVPKPLVRDDEAILRCRETACCASSRSRIPRCFGALVGA